MVEKSPDQFDNQKRIAAHGEENATELRRLFERYEILSNQLLELIAEQGNVIADAINTEDVLDELMELALQEVALIQNLKEIARQVDPHFKRNQRPQG